MFCILFGRYRINQGPHMDAFLPPIEKPKGLMMKLAYYFTRRQFGKVITPLKVHSARLPAAFGLLSFPKILSGPDLHRKVESSHH
jgi:hypothetical protein